MKTNSPLILAGCLAGGLLAAPALRADIILTIENPGVQSTTVSGAATETFDSAPLGDVASPYATAVGTLSGGTVVASTYDGGQYGGADETAFFTVLGDGSSATLIFPAPEDYFGLWWAAGDPGNLLKLYDDGTLISSYQFSEITPDLSAAYYGNPNNGLDSGQPFVYLDFTTAGGTKITSVEFDNITDSGFEMDNLSVFGEPISPPGRAVPDGGWTLALLTIGIGGLLALRPSRRLGAGIGVPGT
ncbi:MAG: Npun_F0296 family exosortase-dependent surface protein [Opitutaceae bacterium]